MFFYLINPKLKKYNKTIYKGKSADFFLLRNLNFSFAKCYFKTYTYYDYWNLFSDQAL